MYCRNGFLSQRTLRALKNNFQYDLMDVLFCFLLFSYPMKIKNTYTKNHFNHQ